VKIFEYFAAPYSAAVHSLGTTALIYSIYNIVFFFTGSTASLGPGLCCQFHDRFTDGRTPWTSDQLVARSLPKHRTTQTHNKHIHQTSMPCVGFEPAIPASELAKTVHASDRSATVTGIMLLTPINCWSSKLISTSLMFSGHPLSHLYLILSGAGMARSI
jgi:hypothetical protein